MQNLTKAKYLGCLLRFNPGKEAHFAGGIKWLSVGGALEMGTEGGMRLPQAGMLGEGPWGERVSLLEIWGVCEKNE